MGHNQQNLKSHDFVYIEKLLCPSLKTSQEEIQLYKEEWYQRNTKLKGLRNNISNLHLDVKLAHDSYKNSMTFFKVFGISLAVIIIFILVTKKIILHETALPGK